MATAGRPAPVTLDQLIALNDEIAALVRAGVPLERGLADAGRDVGGRLGSLERAIAERAGRGEPLGDAVRAAGGGMPEVYRAIVEAGLRSGHLARALEGLAAHARGVADARRVIGQALLYPVLVFALAYALFVGFAWQAAPRFVAAFEALGLPRFAPLAWLAALGRTAAAWGPVVPAILLGLGLAWIASGWSRALDTGTLGRWIGWLPGVGTMLEQIRNANFADLLALLVEHDVGLAEAIPLAADASGDRRFRTAAGELAGRIARGDGVPDPGAGPGRAGVPPLIAWMVASGTRQAQLVPALRHAAANYRRRSIRLAEGFRATLPVAALLVIGGVTVLVYGLILFVPLSTMLDGLGMPSNR